MTIIRLRVFLLMATMSITKTTPNYNVELGVNTALYLSYKVYLFASIVLKIISSDIASFEPSLV